MSESEPWATSDRRLAAVHAWLRSATGDLAAARALLISGAEDIEPFVVAFHAQQAAEKGIKALLLWQGTDFPPTHDLTALVGLLQGDLIAIVDPVLADLTVFAVRQRYPASSYDPMTLHDAVDWPEAETAVAVAQTFVDAVRARVGPPDGAADPRPDGDR